MTQHSRRSGSALVIVLGMTAVLMMMAIAFSVLMRTERSGMTNLKHALTARQTTHTAIARVMSAIDQSFEHPTNSWPIAGWDPPYLSSFASTTQDWQNASIKRTEDRKTNARLLTDELSRHLSPSQLALAKSAKIDWVTIRAGVGASEATTQGGPKNDMIIARYAFLAFNTTGLLDMNTAPMTNGTDAVKQQALAGTDFVKFLGREGDANLIAQRTKLGEFTSYAEMWRSLLGDKRYKYKRNEVVTPDLLNTFSMSLDEVDPDGKMKLFIPQGTAGKTFKNDTEKKTYAKLALERFERIFKDEKKFTNNMDVDLSWTPLPKLTRAQLATQALIDYIDDDRKPNGGIWSDAPVDPLNYPCTENVPMINQAYAQFEVTESPTVMKPAETAGDPTTWYKIYNVRLNVLCRAQYFGTDAMPSGYTLGADFELTGFEDFYVKCGFINTSERKMYINNNTSFFHELSRAEKDAFTAKMQLTPASNDGNLLAANGIKEFQVRVYPASTITQPEPAVLGWHKFTLPEESNDPKPLALEVRVSAKVTSATDGVVHQVPAPAMYPARDEYRIRLDPGIHPKRSGGGGEPYAEGWALCVDPRFAYNTRAIETYPGEGYIAWVTGEMCSPDGSIRSENRMAFRPMWEVADILTELEESGNIISGPSEHNRLVDRVIFRNFGTEKLSARNTRMLMNAFAKDQKIYPDVFHTESLGGKMFIDNGEDKTKALKFIVADKPMTSIAEFGNLLIGPWETLSLFATFAPGTDELKIDFHRVSDYFSLNEARYPKLADIPAGGLGAINEEYLPAIHSGKLNLNPQLKVICDDDIGESGKLSNLFNEDPLAVVLASAPVDEAGALIPFNRAKTEAEKFYADVAISGQHRDDPIDMFRFTSDVGNVNVASNANPVLSAVMATGKAKTDADRERFLGNVLDRITTRGQTYLVIVRADAYSPKYGSEGAQGGTTLATEYALLELWRDSEPNRHPDGTYYPDKTARVLPVHSWFIRSCRFFSP